LTKSLRFVFILKLLVNWYAIDNDVLLATGNWRLANCTCFDDVRISIYFILRLATGGWQLAAGNWLTASAAMMIVFQFISFCG
jgi:protein-S-isoprenylcysteine O-methyltransferase Ste14